MTATTTSRAPTGATEFHSLMAAAIVAGLTLAFSAGDLGAFAPMLIALGLTAVVFGAVGEGVFGAVALVRWWRQRRSLSQGEGA